MKISSEKRIFTAFEIGVIIKTIQGALEIIGAGILIFINTQSVVQFIASYTREELIEDPHDIVSKFLAYIGQHISTNNFFVVVYLLSHGLIKLFLVIGLFHKKLWSYYAFISVILVFIVYQIYRYNISHSPVLLIFTLFDILLVYLTWLESRILKKHLKEQTI